MLSLNFVNLIQSGIFTVGILGALLLWRTQIFKGIALVLALTSLSSFFNILEESGLTRDIYLVSPIFILVFGPAIYLAAKQTIHGKLASIDYWHLAPVLPLLFFTHYTQQVIAIGTLWRLAYTVLTVMILTQYHRQLSQQRSDSDEYSLRWLVWLVAVTACFNFVDLIRLNIQPLLSHQPNIIGQGINNFIWLLTDMVIIYNLVGQKKFPTNKPEIVSENTSADKNEYIEIYSELNKLFVANKWYLKPRLTLAELSNLTGLQSRDISRAINLIAEKSFNDYVNQYRVDHVCKLFKEKSTNSVTDIFNEAGFSSKASFNKVFKQFTGLTPSAYKQQYQV